MKDWIGELEHSDLQTPEASAALDKYNSAEEALVGGLNAMKQVGKPFKLPESIDKLPDDATRQSFMSQVNKILGAVEKEEDLADVNFSEGLADARAQNEGLVAAIKKFAVGKPKSLVKEMVKFINGYNQELLNNTAAAELEKAKEIRNKLVSTYGSEKEVDKNFELVRRLFMNPEFMGLTKEEYEQSGKDFFENYIMKNYIASKGLMNLAKEVVTEGSTEQTGNRQVQNRDDQGRLTKKDGPTGKALGWNK